MRPSLKPGGDHQTPGDYAKLMDRVRATLDCEAFLFLETVASSDRNRLVQAGVPFIVPGNQMFLPMLMVDLREHFPRPRQRRQGEKLLVSTQTIVLYQLVHGELEGLAKKNVAERIGYSAMMVSNAADELEAHGLCSIEKNGRARSLRFQGPPYTKVVEWLRNERDIKSDPELVRNFCLLRKIEKGVGASDAGAEFGIISGVVTRLPE